MVARSASEVRENRPRLRTDPPGPQKLSAMASKAFLTVGVVFTIGANPAAAVGRPSAEWWSQTVDAEGRRLQQGYTGSNIAELPQCMCPAPAPQMAPAPTPQKAPVPAPVPIGAAPTPQVAPSPVAQTAPT